MEDEPKKKKIFHKPGGTYIIRPGIIGKRMTVTSDEPYPKPIPMHPRTEHGKQRPDKDAWPPS